MKPAGIYIHIPFCRSRCSYCDFATGMYDAAVAERYVRSLINEIASWRAVEQGSSPTPSPRPGSRTGVERSATAQSISTRSTSAAARRRCSRRRSWKQYSTPCTSASRFPRPEMAEVTIEINPGSATPETLAQFRGLGVNRASFGAQTFDDRELARLGRSHSSDDTRRTFRHLRDAGFYKRQL